ncbi:hypothetical protein [Candidatus Uabimicrobium sp. HlEnr_7]|uniref:hypothetical protein n=1 Tax=Candidatus Uabimicrobium helgolandensis TaxID=3095367 RepID=UPI003558C710
MPLNELSQHLDKLKEILPNVLSEISDETLRNNLENTTQSLINLIPVAKKTLNDTQDLVDAFGSWQKENTRLQNALSSFGMALPEMSVVSVNDSEGTLDETAKEEIQQEVKGNEGTLDETAKEEIQQEVKGNEGTLDETAKEEIQQEVKGNEGALDETIKEEKIQQEVKGNEDSLDETVKEEIQQEVKDNEDSLGEATKSEEVSLTKVDVNSLNKRDEFLTNALTNLSDSPIENEKPSVTISTPQKHFDTIDNLGFYLSEDEVMQELQVDLTDLKEMVEQKKLIPTVIDDKNYFSKKKVSLLRSVAMESSTIVIEKPVKQPMSIFGGKSSSETSKKEKLKDYYNENEVMEELQIDLASLKEMVEGKKLIPTVIDDKNYFSKRKVLLLRSMAMELSTIVIQKPKKKSPLHFWKDK